MKTVIFPVLILVILFTYPVMAEPTQTIPTNAPVTDVMPVANVTAAPPLPAPEPVTSAIPATPTAPTDAPTPVLTAAPVDMITVALTTIPLPPHELDTGQGFPSDLGLPEQSGFGIPGLVQADRTLHAGTAEEQLHPDAAGDNSKREKCGTSQVWCRGKFWGSNYMLSNDYCYRDNELCNPPSWDKGWEAFLCWLANPLDVYDAEIQKCVNY
ncbi:MAG: hypothetical protein Q8R70_00535 [Methanoregula sp.]|nr:hypothetical protein [Methanoregula sp.]